MMQEGSYLTDSLYFDNDCISAFLWVKSEHYLVTLYPGKIIVPRQVYNEISLVPPLKARLDAQVTAGNIVICSIASGSPEEALYNKFAYKPDAGHVIIGKGEAAAIALASAKNGIVASNNLKDVAVYVTELGLQHITTGDILVEAYNRSIITEADANILWQNMLAKKRKLGAASFPDYLSAQK
jgi:predicted nucleic acid-binding protein